MGIDTHILVTGGGGQLGKALAILRPDAVVLNRAGLDVTDPAAVMDSLADHNPDVVINAAAYTKVKDAETNPGAAAAVNAEAVGNLADACARHEALLIQISTDFVFSGDKSGPYNEDDETGPLNVYGRTKLEGERRAAAAEHLIVRTSRVFGAGGNFIRSILGSARDRESIDVVDDQWGRPTYAADLADGILELIDKGQRGLIHLAGGGEPTTWARLAEAAVKAAGLSTRINHVPTTDDGVTRPRNSVLDCSKAASIGVQLRPWPDAVEEYVKESL